MFLATLGTVAQHTARATFATNLLAAGGIAADLAGATKDADELVAAYDGQPVVCLAGSDQAYAEWGEAAASARVPPGPPTSSSPAAGRLRRRVLRDGRRRARVP